MLEYARWKYILVGVVLAAGAAVRAAERVRRRRGAADRAQGPRADRRDAAQPRSRSFLKDQNVALRAAPTLDNGRLMVRFADDADAAQAATSSRTSSGLDERVRQRADVRVARAARGCRRWACAPMPLGLDLRGGLYLLYQVDVDGAVDAAAGELRAGLPPRADARRRSRSPTSRTLDRRSRTSRTACASLLPPDADRGRGARRAHEGAAGPRARRDRRVRAAPAVRVRADRRSRSASGRTTRSSRTSRRCAIA